MFKCFKHFAICKNVVWRSFNIQQKVIRFQWQLHGIRTGRPEIPSLPGRPTSPFGPTRPVKPGNPGKPLEPATMQFLCHNYYNYHYSVHIIYDNDSNDNDVDYYNIFMTNNMTKHKISIKFLITPWESERCVWVMTLFKVIQGQIWIKTWDSVITPWSILNKQWHITDKQTGTDLFNVILHSH